MSSHLNSFDCVSAFPLLTPGVEHMLISEFIATSGLVFFPPSIIPRRWPLVIDPIFWKRKLTEGMQRDKELAPHREQ